MAGKKPDHFERTAICAVWLCESERMAVQLAAGQPVSKEASTHVRVVGRKKRRATLLARCARRLPKPKR
jgi:hypothetical protein